MPAANPHNLGCYYCGQPSIALIDSAPETGTYIARFCYAGTEVCIEFPGVEGEALYVPIGNLGSPYTYTFTVEAPSGDPVEHSVDGGTFNRFLFCLKTALVGEATLLDMTGVSCDNLTDETKGLTTAQKEGCILPTIEMDDAPLTDPQVADLTARLCGSAEPANYVAKNTNNTTLATGSIASGATQDIAIPDTGIGVVNSEGTQVVAPVDYASGEDHNVTGPDGSARLVDTAGTQISATPIPSGSLKTIVAPNGAVELVNSLAEAIETVTVKSGETLPKTIADSRVRNNSTPTWFHDVPAGHSPYTLPQVRVVLRDGTTVLYDYQPTPTIIHTEAANPVPVLREYSSSTVWTKPAGLKEVIVVAFGAGGGGGSGRLSGGAANRNGGGSGSGGAMVIHRIPEASLAGTVAVTIGAGGAGGGGKTGGATQNGIPGTSGGDTSFGSHVVARGGGGGGGGTGAGVTGGANGSEPSLCVPAYGPFSWQGAIRVSSAAIVTPANGGHGMTGLAVTAAGGSGGSQSFTPIAYYGGNGGGMYVNGVLVTGPNGAAAGADGANGTDNVLTTVLDHWGFAPVNSPGTGGAGGASDFSAVGGAGGNGGHCAGGGGGGAASTTTKAAGNGGQGLLYVIEVYN